MISTPGRRRFTRTSFARLLLACLLGHWTMGLTWAEWVPVEVGDWPGYRRGTARSVVVAGGHAYVPTGDAGVRIVDLTVPENPRRLGVKDRQQTPIPRAQAVAVEGRYACVVPGSDGLDVCDVGSFRAT